MSPRNKSEDNTSEDKASWEVMNDISKEKGKQVSGQKQVSKQKKAGCWRRCNVGMLILSVVILLTLCMMLMARVRTLDGTVAKLKAQVESLMRLTVQQKQMIEQMAEETQTAMEDKVIVGQLDKETGDGELPGDEAAEAWEDEYEEEVDAAHKVYLTFDDGPSANTEKILDILEEYDVKATFFVVGTACENNEEALKKIVEAGHTLGMHSCSHKYSELYASVESFGEDLKRQQDYLYEVTGVKSTIYRFPGGSSNKVSDIPMKEFAQYMDSQGVRFFDWNISSGDGGSYLFPVETILENCTSNISKYSRSVILMHDAVGKTTTLEALPDIIEKIQAMEDTVLLPITGGTEPVQHIQWKDED